ncbi:MAG: type II CAAX endopeptidase family protein [Tissierellia bacterium]|nr:type II CAAX endopeptidase family protein [Tissierellia bacterium]
MKKKLMLIPAYILSTVIGFLLAGFLFSIVASLALKMTITKDLLQSYTSYIYLFSTVFQLIGLVVYLKYVLKKDLTYVNWRNNFSKLFKGYLLGFLMSAFIAIILLITNSIKISSYDFSFLKWIFVFLIAFLIQAAGEELLIRGFVYNFFKEKFSVLKAIIISSIIFTLFHVSNDGFNLFSILNTFLMGIFLANLVNHTKSLELTTGIHAAWNFFISIFFGFNVSGVDLRSFIKLEYLDQSLTGGKYGPEASVLFTILIMILLALSYKIIHNKKELS